MASAREAEKGKQLYMKLHNRAKGIGNTTVGRGAKLEDSNMANYGSDEMKAQMRDKAKMEEQFRGAGQREGVEVWRAENVKVGAFGVQRWPKVGEFLDGDSFIVLETRKDDSRDNVGDGENFVYDVYYWLGKNSTQDERGVVAMKTVELDDLLYGLPIQHRVTQGNESNHFKSLFPGGRLVVKKGGIKSGFRNVKGGAGAGFGEVPARLFMVKGKMRNNQYILLDLPLESKYVTDGDVFVLTKGAGTRRPTFLQWNGPSSSGQERALANHYVGIMKAWPGMGGSSKRVIDGTDDDEFFGTLKGGYAAKGTFPGFDVDGDGTVDETDTNDSGFGKKSMKKMKLCNIWRVKLNELYDKILHMGDVEMVHMGPFKQSVLKSNGIFIVGIIPHIMVVWIGQDVPKKFHYLMMAAMEDYTTRCGLRHMRVMRVVEGDRRHERALRRALV